MVRLLHYSDLETVLDEPAQTGALAGAIAARDGEDALVLGSGDNTAPGALSLATDGRAVFPFYRTVDPEADTFGNHDFDFGIETARDLAAEAPTPWLAANVERDGDRFAPEATSPSRLVDVDGQQVGIVGVAHPKTGAMNPGGDALSFTDPIAAVREESDTLRANGADHVVVVSHCGHNDTDIAQETDVAAVLGGHVHDVHTDIVDGTAVVRPGRAGRHFAEVTIGDTPEITIHDVNGDHADTDLVDALREMISENGLDEVVATVETPIERTEEAATEAESRVGNFVADALRWQADADVAISPSGGIRAGDPLVDEVTVADLYGLLPYEDDLAVVELPGDRLRDAFVAVPFGYHTDDYPERYCSHVSGAQVVWDDEAGELVEGRVDGELIDDDRTYTLAVADYLVETDFVNDAFGEADVIERCGLAREAVVEYAREVGLDTAIEGRIERPALA